MKSTIFRLLIILSGLSLPVFQVSGQENLEKWLMECEKDTSVDITVIDNKFPDTRKPDSYIVKVTLRGKSELEAGMYKAYQTDRSEAHNFADKRVNGKMVPQRCVFSNSEPDGTVTETVFNFYYDTKNGEITATMIKTFDSGNAELKKKRNRWFEGG